MPRLHPAILPDFSTTLANSPVLAENEQSETGVFPFHEEIILPPENEVSFHLQEEHLQDISLADESHIFNKKGLHFVHLDYNSILNKIDEIRDLVINFKPHVICFSETKLDSTVTNTEISIDGYTNICHDRNRHGGGVAIFISNAIHYNERTDFSKDFENIFIDILLPKTAPILFGVVYRPPSQLNFDELLTSCLLNSKGIDKQEVYILGDTNYNLLDRKGNFILKKGYRFSSNESNFSTPLYLTKKYVELIRTFGLTQIIEDPTRTTDSTSSLLDHILVNTPSKVTQSGVLNKCISDHDLIYMTRKHVNVKIGQHNTIKIRSMKNYSKELFNQKLSEVQFPDYSSFENVNEAYADLSSKLIGVIDSIAPLKQIRLKQTPNPGLIVKFWKKFESGTNQEKNIKNLAYKLILIFLKMRKNWPRKLSNVKNVIILKISFKLILPNLHNFGRF